MPDENQKVIVTNQSLTVVASEPFPVTMNLPLPVSGTVEVLSSPTKYDFWVDDTSYDNPGVSLKQQILNKQDEGYELWAWPTINGTTLLIYRKPKKVDG